MGNKMKGIMLTFGGVGIWLVVAEGIFRLCGQIIPSDVFGEIDMRGSIYFLIASLSLVAYHIPKKALPSVICWIIYPTTMVFNGVKLLKFKKRDKKVMKIKDPRIQEILKLAWVVVLGIGLILLGVGCWWVYYLIGAHVIGPCFADGEVSAKAGWGVIIFLHVVAAYIFFTSSGGGSASAGGIFVVSCLVWLIAPTLIIISALVAWSDYIGVVIERRKERRKKEEKNEIV